MNKRILSYSIVVVGFFYGFETVALFGTDLPMKQFRHTIAKVLRIAHNNFSILVFSRTLGYRYKSLTIAAPIILSTVIKLNFFYKSFL